ncbi:MAG: type II toxin-antitoxin system death-on-curing family toxin [Alphaproteobacteria bacterium]
MIEPIWIQRLALELLHDESLAEHGGSSGLRDEGLLESALARPRNLHTYEGVSDLARPAASYAFGLAKNHPFVDGNKRAAFIAATLFMRLNGTPVKADQVDAYKRMIALAAGEIGEEEFAAWLRENVKPR